MIGKLKQFNVAMNRILDRYDRYVYYRWNKLPKFNRLMIWNGLGLMVMAGCIIHIVVGYVIFGLIIIQLRMYIEESGRHIVREL
jgi:hypothetical protein